MLTENEESEDSRDRHFKRPDWLNDGELPYSQGFKVKNRRQKKHNAKDSKNKQRNGGTGEKRWQITIDKRQKNDSPENCNNKKRFPIAYFARSPLYPKITKAPGEHGYKSESDTDVG